MLTQAQIEKWHEDGFIVIEHFLTAEEVRRYKRMQDDTMDESFFPILWSRTGYRTPHLPDAREAAPA